MEDNIAVFPQHFIPQIFTFYISSQNWRQLPSMHITWKISNIDDRCFLFVEEMWFQLVGKSKSSFNVFHFFFFYCFWFQVFLHNCSYPGHSVQWAENWIFLAWLMKKQSMCFRWFSEISAFVRKKKKGWGKIKNTVENIGIFGSLQAGFGEAEKQRCFGLLSGYTLNNWADIRGPQFDL